MRLQFRSANNAAPGRLPSVFMGILFLVIGVCALVGGIVWGVNTKKFVDGASRASGTVIELQRRQSSSDDGPSYYPVVRFTDASGKDVTFTSSTGSNPPSNREGDKVAVLYDPNNPDEAELDSFFALWFGPLMVGGLFGTIFPLVGVFAIIGSLRAAAQRNRLIEGGTKIVAELQGVERVPQGWTVLARATDPRGIPRVFRSAPLPRDPGPSLAGRASVEVIVAPNDYGTYEVHPVQFDRPAAP